MTEENNSTPSTGTEVNSQITAPANSSILGQGTPPADNAQPVQPTGSNQQATPSFDFYKDGKPTDAFISSIPEEFKTARGLLTKYHDMASFAKGVEGLQYLAGQKGFEKPADDAPQSVKDAFAAKLRALNGVPEKLEDYKISKPEKLPDGVQWDDGRAKAFSEFAHKEGLSPAQAEHLIALHTNFLAEDAKAQATAGEQQVNEARVTLKQTYGSQFEKAIVKAQGAAEWLGLGNKDANGVFQIDPSLGNNAQFIIAMNRVAEKIGESQINPGTTISAKVSMEEQVKELTKQSYEASAKGDLSKAESLNRQRRELYKKMEQIG